LETKDVVETTLALDNYKRACDCGRGAVFLSVARGKVAEGIDFDRHYGRCVLIFGIPYQYTLSHVLRARLNYMRERYGIRDNDFLTFDALRQSAQCVGRVIRSKTDYGIVILADSRYNRADKRSKFPPWILQFMKESSMNLATDAAVDQIKTFLRQMGQPIEQAALHEILLNEAQVSSMFQRHKVPGVPDAAAAAAAAAAMAAVAASAAQDEVKEGGVEEEDADAEMDIIALRHAEEDNDDDTVDDSDPERVTRTEDKSKPKNGVQAEEEYEEKGAYVADTPMDVDSSSTTAPGVAHFNGNSQSNSNSNSSVLSAKTLTQRIVAPSQRSLFLFDDLLDLDDN
jgi:hypothetical protein